MKLKSISLFLVTILFVSRSVLADTQVSTSTSLRRNIATVVICGLGGAVLAISTLSFYGNPQDHVGDITTGFGLGLVAGATYVTLMATDQNREAMSLDPIKELATKNRNPRPALAYAWEF